MWPTFLRVMHHMLVRYSQSAASMSSRFILSCRVGEEKVLKGGYMLLKQVTEPMGQFSEVKKGKRDT